MRTIKTIKEYQDCIDEAIKTNSSIQIKLEMDDDTLEKAAKELKMDRVDIVVTLEGNIIKPL